MAPACIPIYCWLQQRGPSPRFPGTMVHSMSGSGDRGSNGSGTCPQWRDAIIFSGNWIVPPEAQAMENEVFRDAAKTMGLELPSQVDHGERVEANNCCVRRFLEGRVSGDGAVTTCTRDSHLLNKVGSISETPFSTLYNETMRRRRSAVSLGDYSGLSVCQSCLLKSLTTPKSLRMKFSCGSLSMINVLDRGLDRLKLRRTPASRPGSSCGD